MIRRRNGATNWQLSCVALKYTSVISELRKDGYNIIATRTQLPNGRASNTWRYNIIERGAKMTDEEYAKAVEQTLTIEPDSAVGV